MIGLLGDIQGLRPHTRLMRQEGSDKKGKNTVITFQAGRFNNELKIVGYLGDIQTPRVYTQEKWGRPEVHLLVHLRGCQAGTDGRRGCNIPA